MTVYVLYINTHTIEYAIFMMLIRNTSGLLLNTYGKIIVMQCQRHNSEKKKMYKEVFFVLQEQFCFECTLEITFQSIYVVLGSRNMLDAEPDVHLPSVFTVHATCNVESITALDLTNGACVHRRQGVNKNLETWL